MNEVTLNRLMDFLEELPTKNGPIRLPERGAIAKLVIGACEKLEPDQAIDVTVDRLMEESVTLAPQALRARVQTTLIALGLLPHPQPQNAPSQQQKQPQQPQQTQQHPSERSPNGGLSAEAREELFVTNLLDGLMQGKPPRARRRESSRRARHAAPSRTSSMSSRRSSPTRRNNSSPTWSQPSGSGA